MGPTRCCAGAVDEHDNRVRGIVLDGHHEARHSKDRLGEAKAKIRPSCGRIFDHKGLGLELFEMTILDLHEVVALLEQAAPEWTNGGLPMKLIGGRNDTNSEQVQDFI